MLPRAPLLGARVLRGLALIFGFFGGASAIFQALELSPTYRLVTFAATLMFGFGMFISLRMARAHANALAAARAILSHPARSSTFHVAPIQHEAQLRELWELDSDSYGSASIEFKLFASWWHRYHAGVHALFADEQIIGGFGLWPLCKTPFREMLEGSRRERELSARAIELPSPTKLLPFWYISGIVLKERRRKTVAIRVLLAGCLAHWVHVIRNLGQVNVCAQAMSADGEALLRKFQFYRYRSEVETLDRYPIYARLQTSPQDLQHLLGHLRSEDRDAPRPIESVTSAVTTA